MIFQRLGKSVLTISRIGLGGNIFGHFTSQKETTEIIAEALNSGINFIDTASVYSEGQSEIFIGKAIKKSREKWIIASKVGVGSNENPGEKGSRSNIIKCVEESLARLKTDYIDLYQMHHYDPVTPLEETIHTFHELIRQGKIRFFGVTNFSASQIKKTLASSNKYSIQLASTQNHYHFLKRGVEAAIIPLCQKEKLGFIVYGVLARGIFSGKYKDNKSLPIFSRGNVSRSVQKDLTPHILKIVATLSTFAKAHNRTMSELAIAWILARSTVSSVLVGVRNPKQLKDNIRAISWTLTSKDIKKIDQLIGDLNSFVNTSLGSFVSN